MKMGLMGRMMLLAALALAAGCDNKSDAQLAWLAEQSVEAQARQIEEIARQSRQKDKGLASRRWSASRSRRSRANANARMTINSELATRTAVVTGKVSYGEYAPRVYGAKKRQPPA